MSTPRTTATVSTSPSITAEASAQRDSDQTSPASSMGLSYDLPYNAQGPSSLSTVIQHGVGADVSQYSIREAPATNPLQSYRSPADTPDRRMNIDSVLSGGVGPLSKSDASQPRTARSALYERLPPVSTLFTSAEYMTAGSYPTSSSSESVYRLFSGPLSAEAVSYEPLSASSQLPPPSRALSSVGPRPFERFPSLGLSENTTSSNRSEGSVGMSDPRSLPTQPRSRRSVIEPLPFRHTLKIRQHPIAARACGYGERDRRAIDPPPIVELKVTMKDTDEIISDSDGALTMDCTVWNSETDTEDRFVQEKPKDQQGPTRRLIGAPFASPYDAKDEHGQAGTFFVFPDLSIRTPGDFRLHFRLIRLDSTNLGMASAHYIVAEITSEVFTAYNPKSFPGMLASSALIRALRQQGMNVGVRKKSAATRSQAERGTGSGGRLAKRKRVDSSESEDEDEDDDDEEQEEREENEQSELDSGHPGKKERDTEDDESGSAPSGSRSIDHSSQPPDSKKQKTNDGERVSVSTRRLLPGPSSPSGNQ